MTKVLLVGIGRWGANHFRVLHSLPIGLFVAELDAKRLESARGAGIAADHLTTNYQDFVAKVDAAAVVTPAPGAKYKGKTVGSMGFCGTFSFFPSKNLTVLGDGGCICTNDDALAGRLRKLRNHGRKDKFTNDEIGYNLRFNEIQAAIGRVGLKHLDRLNEGRRKVAARYNERLKGIVQTPPERPWATPVYHMYVIRCDRRDQLAQFLQERGIGTGIHYPVANHQQPAIAKLFQGIPKLPKTEQAVKEILSLPVYGELPLDDVDYVCDCIAEFYGKK